MKGEKKTFFPNQPRARVVARRNRPEEPKMESGEPLLMGGQAAGTALKESRTKDHGNTTEKMRPFKASSGGEIVIRKQP